MPIGDRGIGKGYFLMDNKDKYLMYGVKVYQVWRWEWAPGGVDNTLEYETTSKAKARAVLEYLGLKAEQDWADTWRSPEMKGTVVPSSIKF